MSTVRQLGASYDNYLDEEDDDDRDDDYDDDDSKGDVCKCF